MKVFATNLRHLLLQPPMRGLRVMGIDPGYRTGCKVALADETGKFLGGTTIYPHEPKKQWDQALETLRALVTKAQVQVIAIGNGTASRETEKLVAELIDAGVEVSYAIISEAGASVYSASRLAREEFPDLDVSMRGAISIARRLQDPLAELVKIDPQSIGVGLYQHDVEQKALREALASTKGFKAVTGEISYTRPTGVPLKGVSIISVHNGKYKVEEIWFPKQ